MHFQAKLIARTDLGQLASMARTLGQHQTSPTQSGKVGRHTHAILSAALLASSSGLANPQGLQVLQGQMSLRLLGARFMQP